jgi:hypothetical protein
MTRLSMFAGIAGAALFASGASAQYVPGSEIVGQTVQVETNGVVNNVTFEPGGTALPAHRRCVGVLPLQSTIPSWAVSDRDVELRRDQPLARERHQSGSPAAATGRRARLSLR